MATDLPDRQELLDSALVLCAGGDAMPVEGGGPAVDAVNHALWRQLDKLEEVPWLAVPCGTALAVDSDLLAQLRDGVEIDEGRFPGWRDFLAPHGILAP